MIFFSCAHIFLFSYFPFGRVFVCASIICSRVTFHLGARLTRYHIALIAIGGWKSEKIAILVFRFLFYLSSWK